VYISLHIFAVSALSRAELVTVTSDDRGYPTTSVLEASPFAQHALKDRIQLSRTLTPCRQYVFDLVRLGYWATELFGPIPAICARCLIEATAYVSPFII
jgi:hypothetical protein